MRRIIYTILAVLVPTLLFGQTYRVQSGDHANFTRLVIYTADPETWKVGRVDGGYELRTSNPEGSFDVSSAFDLIKRNRVGNLVDRENGNLFLAVDCNCNLNAFEIPQGYVLDIRDGAPSEQSEFEQAFVDDVPGVPAASVRLNSSTDSASGKIDPQLLQIRNMVPRTNLAWSEQLAIPIRNPGAPDLPKNSKPEPPSTEISEKQSGPNRVAELERSILDQLARAAAQGLVIADLEQTAERLSEAIPGTSTDVISNENPIEIPPEVAPDSNFDHVNFETAISRGLPDSSKPDPTTLRGDLCFPDSWFDIATWGFDREDDNGFFVGRTAIVGEFDVVDTHALEDLIKRYLFLTFGAESESLISVFGSELDNREVYSAIAEIMDTGSSSNGAIPPRQIECDSKVAFWALLANSDQMQTPTMHREAVLGTFSELPLHLRRHLGPYLAKRYLELGDTETAKEISYLLDRAPGSPDSNLALLDAEIDVSTGEFESGIRAFETVFRSNGPRATDAFVRMIDESIDNGVALPNESSLAAAALARERAGTTTGAELLRVQLRAEANSGRIQQAVQQTQMLELSGELEPDQALKLRKEFLNLAVSSLENSEFVEAILLDSLQLDTGADSNSLRRRIADRLIEIGLSKLALETLGKNRGNETEADLLLAARAYLGNYDPVGALVQLNGQSSEQALRLKAEAYQVLNEDDQLREVLLQLDDPDALNRFNWQSKNWAEIAESGPNPFREAAMLRVSNVDLVTSDLPSLASSSAMIQRSSSTRATLGNLLNSIDNP